MSSLAIVFGILDNFGSGGGRNGFIDIESVTKQDTPFAIVLHYKYTSFLSLKNNNVEIRNFTSKLFNFIWNSVENFWTVTLLLLIYQ